MGRRSAENKSARVKQVLEVLHAHLPQLREQHGVTNLWAFGSYVRGEAGKRSDLDLLVEFDRAPTLLEFVRLERELGELLGIKVDLVMKSALKPRIGERILSEVVAV